MNIMIIGASAGGPRILKEIFTELPLLNGCIVLVQHMPKYINESFCRTLNQATEMEVHIAQDGDFLKQGIMYIAPSEVHLELMNNRTIRLTTSEKVNFVCPSIDVTMKSVQKESGNSIIGVILTGMGKDGAEGIRHLKKIGGITIAQDEETSIIYGMPREAVATGIIDYILTPPKIKEKFIELLS
jgi:two-component system chemotaxis response regulator CheB